MLMQNDQFVTKIIGLESITENLIEIGTDKAGPIVTTDPMTAVMGLSLTIRMRKRKWFLQGIEPIGKAIALVFSKQYAGRNCVRCQGLGMIPHYKHIKNGYCFACHATGITRSEDNKYRYVT
jgi:hypothetical protein